MKILVINPNTTLSMTEKIGAAARSVAAPGTAITAVSPDKGPVSIEGHYDEAYCVPGVVETAIRGAAEGYDASSSPVSTIRVCMPAARPWPSRWSASARPRCMPPP